MGFIKLPKIMRLSRKATVISIIVLLVVGFCCFYFIGPYTGTIIDGDTGKGIEGASVLFYWTKSTPTPAGSISGIIDEKLAYTDKRGKYVVSFFMALRGIFSFFESTRVIIYEPGYQAYVVTIWNDSSAPKSEYAFAKIGNLVKLKKLPPDFSHKAHYEDIDRALWGIEDYAEPDREEFLRRAEWEERWGLAESEKENPIRTAWEERQKLTKDNSGGPSAKNDQFLLKWLALVKSGTEQQKKKALSSLWLLEYPEYRKNNHAFDPILNAMIKDKSPSVREAAAACLRRIGDYSKGCCQETNIVPSLIMALRDSSPRVKAEAAKALAYYRDKRAVGPLAESLRDTDPWVRLNAAFALGEQAAFKGLAPLRAMLSDNSDWRFRFCNREAERAMRRLRTLLTYKINITNEKFYGKYRFEDEFSSQEEMVTFLIEQLEDQEMIVRGAALNSLKYYQDHRLLDIYAKFLKDGPYDLRWTAVINIRDLLKSAQNPREMIEKNVVELLIPLLQEDKEPNQTVVAEILGILGDKKAVIPLIRALSAWTKPNIEMGDNGFRVSAVIALGKIGDEKAYDVLVKALNATLTYRGNDVELKKSHWDL